MIEEGEDLHILIKRLGIAPAVLYGISSGGRSNLIVATISRRYAALIMLLYRRSPAATRLSEEYF